MAKFIGKVLFIFAYCMVSTFTILAFVGYKFGLTDKEKDEFKELLKDKKDQWKYRKYSKII